MFFSLPRVRRAFSFMAIFVKECEENRNLSRTFSMPESIPTPRRASLNELNDDEIILAYNRLQQKHVPIKEEKINEKPEGLSTINDENYQEFLKWMEMKQKSEIEDVPRTEEKVMPSSDVNVLMVTENSEELSDFDEFKDAISEENDEALNVPLFIIEENDTLVLIPTVIEENISPPASQSPDDNVVNAKLMLSNEALQIVTNLSTSSMSLASIKSTDESSNKKRPVTHKKGPAPPVPSATSSNVNALEGFFYDKLTKKHFKETEL